MSGLSAATRFEPKLRFTASQGEGNACLRSAAALWLKMVVASPEKLSPSQSSKISALLDKIAGQCGASFKSSDTLNRKLNSITEKLLGSASDPQLQTYQVKMGKCLSRFIDDYLLDKLQNTRAADSVGEMSFYHQLLLQARDADAISSGKMPGNAELVNAFNNKMSTTAHVEALSQILGTPVFTRPRVEGQSDSYLAPNITLACVQNDRAHFPMNLLGGSGHYDLMIEPGAPVLSSIPHVNGTPTLSSITVQVPLVGEVVAPAVLPTPLPSPVPSPRPATQAITPPSLPSSSRPLSTPRVGGSPASPRAAHVTASSPPAPAVPAPTVVSPAASVPVASVPVVSVPPVAVVPQPTPAATAITPPPSSPRSSPSPSPVSTPRAHRSRASSAAGTAQTSASKTSTKTEQEKSFIELVEALKTGESQVPNARKRARSTSSASAESSATVPVTASSSAPASSPSQGAIKTADQVLSTSELRAKPNSVAAVFQALLIQNPNLDEAAYTKRDSKGLLCIDVDKVHGALNDKVKELAIKYIENIGPGH